MTLEELQLSETHIKKLNKKNIFCAEDILYLFPRKYYDFRTPALINPGLNGKEVGIEGVLKSIVLEKDRVKNIYILKAKIFNKVSENIISINWFGAYYLKDTYRQWIGQDVYCCGKVHYHEIYGYLITNPMLFTNDLDKYKCIYPVYSKFAGISDEYMAACRYKCFQRCDLTDFLSEPLLKEIEHRIQDRQEQIAVNLFDNIYNMDKRCIEKYSVKLLSLKDAFYMIHSPKSTN